MTTDTNKVIITTKTIKVGNLMSQHLSSIKQTSTLTIGGKDVVVSFNIAPDTDNQNELDSPITVVTSSKEVKKAFGSKTNTFTFEHGIQAFNETLAKVQ